MRSFLTAAILIFSLHAGANSVSKFDSMDDFLQKASLNNQAVSFRLGDLNNDGLEDWAGILSKDRGDDPPLIRLVVLIKLRNGSYVESASSMEVEDNFRFSGSSAFDFDIKNSSIYLETTGRTCCTASSTVFQFKLHNGLWRLVGKRTSSGNTVSGEDDNDDISQTEDTNMLTGLTISTVVRGKKKRERRRINKWPTYLLKDFNFSGNYAAP